MGEVDANLGQNLEYSFIGTLVAGLLVRNDASIYVWRRDPEQLRKFKELVEPIDTAFAGGTPRDKERIFLADMLKAQNCQYLLGGRISQEADAIGEGIVVGTDSSGVAEGAEVFGGVEAEATDVAH